MGIISLIISSLLNVVVLICMCGMIANKKIRYNNWLSVLIIVLMTSYWCISYLLTNSFFRIILSFLLLIIACLILLKEKINKSVIIAFFSFIILLFSDVFYVLLNSLIFGLNNSQLQNNVFGTFLTNIVILIFALGFTHILNNPKNKLLSNLAERLTIRNDNSNLYTIFIAFISTIMLIYCVYFEPDISIGLSLGIVIIVIYAVFTVKLVQEKTSNIKLQEDNKAMTSSLTEYEKMYALQRMKNHEYKNDLSILRGMIDKENKKAIDYINQLMNIKVNKNNSWMEILKKIPEGGLQGILYYKLLQMDDLNVNVDFSTSSTYSPSSYIRLSDKVKSEICKLLGIYLDNAIQAVSNINEKNIFLNIDEDKEYIIFKIANNFKGDIDLDRIYESGYTTKEKGHGFGLAIAKEILDRDSLIDNKTQIIKDKFIQEIKIKKCVGA